jgi:GNAT superfamily N-acetyltransferase
MHRMTVTIRRARDDDDLDALNRGDSDWLGEALTRQLHADAGEIAAGMFIGERSGVAVGFATAVGLGIADGHRGRASVFVQSPHRGFGVGAALWASVLEVCAPDVVPGVAVTIDEDDTLSRQIAMAHGLTMGRLHLESRLALTMLDDAVLTRGSTAAAGLTIGTLPPEASDDQWHEFADVHDRLTQDAPDFADGSEPLPYAALRSFLPKPWQVLCARDGDEIVGFTCVYVSDAATHSLNTFLTAVDRHHRGHGLATTLKATHAVALRNAGWHSITTQNLEGNDAILAANRTLGFHRTGARRDAFYDHPPRKSIQEAE